MLVRQPLEHRQVPVVVGVGGVVDRTDHLQGINDDQYCVWVGSKNCKGRAETTKPTVEDTAVGFACRIDRFATGTGMIYAYQVLSL